MYEVFERRYNSLNKEQKLAVDTIEGPVLVIAGPGSGKTELLAIRIANIVKQGFAKPGYILALTFTDSAVSNMQKRLFEIMGREAYKVSIFTFHSFCTNIIHQYPEHFFDAHTFEPISELKQNEILKSIFSKFTYGHPFFSHHDEKGFSYFKDVKERIQNFKEAGLSPDDVQQKILKLKDEVEILAPIVQNSLPTRVTKDTVIPFIEALEKSNTELGYVYAKQITKLFEQGDLSKIKSSLIDKENNNFKEAKYIEKYFALAEVYKTYQNELWRQGFFDFNDMIVYVKEKLLSNNELRAEIEETYQYILVDEFQDTNNAQLSLITSITSNPVLEGRANVFVVGDDDQSIFKFQGADVSNIFNFKRQYRDVATIVLTDNYRSTQKVLDFSKAIIEQGQDRLVSKDTTLTKVLSAQNKNLQEGEIFINSFNSKEEEYLFVAREIKKYIDSGINPEEIVIISRGHKELQNILPYLDNETVSYNYERKENVFDQRHISELITLCTFLETIGSPNTQENDELLAKILSFPFLGIDRITIWKIAQDSYREKKSWLEVMLDSSDTSIKQLAEFLIEVGILAKDTPLEVILDLLIGSRDISIESDEHEDEYFHNSIPKLKTKYISNYKNVYFGEKVLEGDIASYIHFLSSLRVFIYALREFKKGEKLLITDLKEFIRLHKEYNIALLNKTAFVGDMNAINIMTAHKAKGLEFEYVFIINAEENTWTKSKLNNKIPLPKTLPIDRRPDTTDDFLRLFFVALTRAKHTIHITYSDRLFEALADANIQSLSKQKAVETHNDKLVHGLSVFSIPPFAKNERALLEKIVTDYKLSPTHLTNFLNISKGGPKLFLEQNLLRFPQTKSSSSVYGSALHSAIEKLYILTKKEMNIPPFEVVYGYFESEIKKSRLLPTDEENLLKKGKEKLQNYYTKQKAIILEAASISKMEVDFKNQGVEIEGAHITGKIDRLEERSNEIEVVDLKSGKALTSFDYKKTKEDDYENIKKHNYKLQLLMYKLLLENSKDYKGKNITQGSLSFVDSDDISNLVLDFNSITQEEYNDFKKLVVVVYNKIKNLDFPDTSKYEPSSAGILHFEQDLLKE